LNWFPSSLFLAYTICLQLLEFRHPDPSAFVSALCACPLSFLFARDFRFAKKKKKKTCYPHAPMRHKIHTSQVTCFGFNGVRSSQCQLMINFDQNFKKIANPSGLASMWSNC
jgi:hypothetical protein